MENSRPSRRKRPQITNPPAGFDLSQPAHISTEYHAKITYSSRYAAEIRADPSRRYSIRRLLSWSNVQPSGPPDDLPEQWRRTTPVNQLAYFPRRTVDRGNDGSNKRVENRQRTSRKRGDHSSEPAWMDDDVAEAPVGFDMEEFKKEMHAQEANPATFDMEAFKAQMRTQDENPTSLGIEAFKQDTREKESKAAAFDMESFKADMRAKESQPGTFDMEEFKRQMRAQEESSHASLNMESFRQDVRSQANPLTFDMEAFKAEMRAKDGVVNGISNATLSSHEIFPSTSFDMDAQMRQQKTQPLKLHPTEFDIEAFKASMRAQESASHMGTATVKQEGLVSFNENGSISQSNSEFSLSSQTTSKPTKTRSRFGGRFFNLDEADEEEPVAVADIVEKPPASNPIFSPPTAMQSPVTIESKDKIMTEEEVLRQLAQKPKVEKDKAPQVPALPTKSPNVLKMLMDSAAGASIGGGLPFTLSGSNDNLPAAVPFSLTMADEQLKTTKPTPKQQKSKEQKKGAVHPLPHQSHENENKSVAQHETNQIMTPKSNDSKNVQQTLKTTDEPLLKMPPLPPTLPLPTAVSSAVSQPQQMNQALVSSNAIPSIPIPPISNGTIPLPLPMPALPNGMPMIPQMIPPHMLPPFDPTRPPMIIGPDGNPMPLPPPPPEFLALLASGQLPLPPMPFLPPGVVPPVLTPHHQQQTMQTQQVQQSQQHGHEAKREEGDQGRKEEVKEQQGDLSKWFAGLEVKNTSAPMKVTGPSTAAHPPPPLPGKVMTLEELERQYMRQ